jgi:AmiR/NasT family two-component response regulator
MARAKALILDPLEESASILRSILEEKNIQVVGWNKTGLKWFNLYSEHRPEFVFVELLMPARDGIFCINKLKLQANTACCILTHSYVGEMANIVEEKAFRAGANAVLQKPFAKSRADVMIERILKLIEMK